MAMEQSEEWGAYVNFGAGDPALPFNSLAGDDYARYTPTTAKRLSATPVAGVALPADAHHAHIFVKDFPIRWRCGATDPTASEGVYWPANTWRDFIGQRSFLENFRFIDTAEGASEVTIAYGRRA